MNLFDLFRYFLVLIVPGMIGAVFFSIAAYRKSECKYYVAFILDLLTFIIMITGLYFCKGVTTVHKLLFEFTCLSFTRRYALLSILIAIPLGLLLGFLRKCFFWIKHD